MNKVWVLVRRYEWEDQSNQTETCDVFAFARFRTAVAKAGKLLKADVMKYGNGDNADAMSEAAQMEYAFSSKYPRHLVQLTNGDNVVYELYQVPVAGRRARKTKGTFLERCLTLGELRRALEKLPDDMLVNTSVEGEVVGESVYVMHNKGSDYVDVGTM